MMKEYSTELLIYLFVHFILFFPTEAKSQAGSLDMDFGMDGWVLTDVGMSNDVGRAIAVQMDGKIVVVGNVNVGTGNTDFALLRYHGDGSIDDTFGVDGIVITPIADQYDNCVDIVIQDDGKIIVVGDTQVQGNYYELVVRRYEEDGSPDLSFGSGGMFISDLDTLSDRGTAVALQEDGKLLVAGTSGLIQDGGFLLLRLDEDGALDQGFGMDGKVILSVGMQFDIAKDLVVQDDGKILVVGETYNGTDYDFGLARIHEDGTIDTEFGSEGVVITSISTTTSGIGSGYDRASSVAQQSDGRIIVAGALPSPGLAIVRYMPEGEIDTSFGENGIVVSNVGTQNNASPDMIIQEDDKILISTNRQSGPFGAVGLMRYTSDGVLDPTFGSDGIVNSELGEIYEIANALTLQSDGKILLTGTAGTMGGSDIVVARYTNDMNTDLSENEAAKIDLRVYPNPSRGNFTLDWSGSESLPIEVYDLLAEKVLGKTVRSGEGLFIEKAGLYVLQVGVGQTAKRELLVVH